MNDNFKLRMNIFSIRNPKFEIRNCFQFLSTITQSVTRGIPTPERWNEEKVTDFEPVLINPQSEIRNPQLKESAID
jgi:hypothetical protein